ncbi:3-oxoacyl-[acyl-carrier-protein] synthase 3 [archaeon HR06]|nr:3-oxoacyl-[acyl-carrier-protein] synthase 3 [archaeon HR06]
MRPVNKVGISGYGAYIPRFRLPSKEIERVWGKGERGIEEKSVAGMDEDTCTMAVEAAKRALSMAKVKTLGAIFVGTESKPYAVKPTATIVAEALGLRRVLASDFEFACKAGTEALQCVIGLVGSGMIEHGMIIASDTAQGRPKDELEYFASSGSVAYIVSKLDGESIAEIEYSVSYVSDTGDFWRRQNQEYPRHLGRFTGEPAYFTHTEKAVKLILEETNYKPSDFTHVIFHQPNPKFPLEVGKRLGFKEEQILKGLLNPKIGNTYSASALLGLARVLDEAKPNDKILLVSFGSGAGSDAFILKVLEGIKDKRVGNESVESMIKNKFNIDYSIYLKFRGEIKF